MAEQPLHLHGGLTVASLLLLLSGLTLLASLVGLAAALPLFLLFSPVLVPAGLLASSLTAGAVALGALSLLSRLASAVRKVASTPDYIEEGKRRVREFAVVAGEKTPHAAMAVVSGGQSATGHKKPENYAHYVAGLMVYNA